MVVIDAPHEAKAQIRTLPLEAPDGPTAAPVIGVAAGLGVLGATLAGITRRRRTAMALGLEAAGPVPDVVVVRTSHTHITGHVEPRAFPLPSLDPAPPVG